MLDAQAKQEYRRRLRELNEELEDQRELDAHQRAEQIESEIDFLSREIARAVGLGAVPGSGTYHQRAIPAQALTIGPFADSYAFSSSIARCARCYSPASFVPTY
jgi:hypothetical protein